MLGKILGALIGRRLAGSNSGTKGAIIGYGAAALARRSVPALAAIGILGWGVRKLYDRRNRSTPSYPSDSAPSSLNG